MLKQDVLDCVHSKVRWYAIHRIKKVAFRLNPKLPGTEDLRGAVNELQYVPDYDYQTSCRVESEVYGENYGKKYPTFAIHEMKEYKFWPFVAGKEWRTCSSLRVTPGSLLSSLMDTYREMEQEGLILRYTTDAYEKAVAYKTKGCLKKSFSSLPSDTSSYMGSTTEEHNAGATTKVIKISFTYFGLSLSHLKKILNDAGIDDVTDADIIDQNPGCVTKHIKVPCIIQRLKDFVAKKSELHMAPSSVQLQSGPNSITERDHSDHPIRRLSKKRFTHGQLIWTTRPDAQVQRPTQERTILDPINRQMLLAKKEERRQRNKRRAKLYEVINKTINESNKAYEKWWMRQMEDPLMTTDSLFTSRPKLSFFGNSWIIDGNLSSEVGTTTKHSTNVGNKQGLAAIMNPQAASTCQNAIIVPSLEAVDTWRCECEVCTGNLLHYIGDLKSRTQRKEKDAKKDEKGSKDIKANEASMGMTSSRKTTTKITGTSSIYTYADQSSAKRGKRKPKKVQIVPVAKKKKSKYDPKIWWETVSTYTTPRWREWQDNEPQDEMSKSLTKPNKSPLVQKLNMTYSFERLRQRRPSGFQEMQIPSEIGKENDSRSVSKQSTLTKQSTIGSTEERKSVIAAPSEQALSENFNMDALLAHHIIYKHHRPEDKSYTKIKLPALNSPPKTQTPKKIATFPCTEDETAISRVTTTLTDKLRTPSSPPIRLYSASNYSKEWKSPDKTCSISHSDGKRRNEYYFLHFVPQNFEELCLAGLNEYIVRFEAVLMENAFHRVESLTINKAPLYSYGNRGTSAARLTRTTAKQH